MKLSDYRNAVTAEYPDCFIDFIGEHGPWTVFENSTRSVILGSSRTPLLTWQDAYKNEFGDPEDRIESDNDRDFQNW